jgi:hypothetical protein
MERQFLEISGTAFNADLIESVDNLAGTGDVHLHFLSGNNRSFSGADADGLRRFFAPVKTAPPEPFAEPKAPAPSKVEV